VQRSSAERLFEHRASHATPSPLTGVEPLQRTLGNRGMTRLLRSAAIQPKLTVDPVDDEYEREADRVADQVMRMPDASSQAPVQRSTLSIQRKCPKCEEEADVQREPQVVQRLCSKCEKEDAVQRKVAPAAEVPLPRHPVKEASLGDRGMLRALDAFRDPARDFSADARAITRRQGGADPPGGIRQRWGPASERAARDFGAVAFTVGADVFADTTRWRPGSLLGDWVLAHEIHHTVEQHGRQPEVALLSEAEFRRRLGARPEQAVVIDALFANPRFRVLWDYLGSCPALPARDHGPIQLVVTPGLRQGGVERFGGYTGGILRKLEINPTKAEHVRNPQELVDTIVHEVIHAVDDVQAACVAAGGAPSPVAAGTATPATGGLPPLGTTELGPGASNPCAESIDIDIAAQQIVTDVIRENMRTTRIGAPTLTFLNDLIRTNPAALAAYDACRRPACAIANPALRAAAINRCSMDVLGTFMTGDLLPSRVLFDFDSHAIRQDAAMSLDLVATFMRANSSTHVILEGHADPKGDPVYNERLALRRANAVKVFLTSRGVPGAQIDNVVSLGEQRPISTRPAEHFQDRRVELIFLSRP
jgi:outer membrane protein OmpA-like peptidoglycan-associated protein